MKLYEAIKQWMEVHKKPSVKHATYERLLISYNLMQHYQIFSTEVSSLTAIRRRSTNWEFNLGLWRNTELSWIVP